MARRRHLGKLRRQREQLKHDDPVAYDVQSKRTWAWRRIEHLGARALSEMAQLRALEMFIDRTDPAPKQPAVVSVPIVVTWGEPPPKSSRSSIPSLTSPPSSRTSNGDDSASSSATGDSEKLFWQ
jgi:hypothetical protein